MDKWNYLSEMGSIKSAILSLTLEHRGKIDVLVLIMTISAYMVI